MADDTPAKSGTAEISRLRALAHASRGTLPYLVATGLVLAVMVWYLFGYVPSKLNYFVGLRFRNLAVASGQVKSKIENLSKALGGAARNVPASDMPRYLEVLVPEIRLGNPLPGSLNLAAGGYRANIAWSDAAQQAAFASQGDFDDLLLADATGAVVWQRERTTPRIGNLNELLSASPPSGGWLPFSLSWSVQTTPLAVDSKSGMPQTATLKPVNLDGSASYLLVQELVLPAASNQPLSDGVVIPAPGASGPAGGARLYVAGLISRRALQSQAMHIPTAYVLVLALPMALLFLTVPVLKLATLTSKERYRFSDVLFLGASAITAAGLGGMLPFVSPTVSAGSDQTLARFADEIESRFTAETQSILDIAAAITERQTQVGEALKALDSPECPVAIPGRPKNRCELWRAMQAAKVPIAPGSVELDVVIWVNQRGEQTEKWSTKTQVTAPTTHNDFDHFKDVAAGRTWYLAGAPDRRFTIEALRAPTTAEMGFVFAIPQKGDGDLLVLNTRPQTLVDPVTPPGYGFAILAPSGRVLFHSQEELSLEENFFQETGNPGDSASKARTRRGVTWTSDYHGRSHRLSMRPVRALTDCPWLIVTFQELEPLLSAKASQESAVLRLFGVNLLILIGVAVGFILYWKFRGQNVRDMLMTMSAVDSKTAEVSRRSLWCLGPLAAVAGGAVWLTYAPEAQRWLDGLSIFFTALPLAAFGVAGYWRKRGARSLEDPDKPSPGVDFRLLAVELTLIVLLAGAAPAAGFSRIAYRLQEQESTERRMEEASRMWSERRGRVLDRVNSRGYSEPTRVLVRGGFAADVQADSPSYDYLGISGIGVSSWPQPPGENDTAGQNWARAILSWTPPPFHTETRTPSQVHLLPAAELKTTTGETGLPVLRAVIDSGSFWADSFSLRTAAALLILGAVGGAVYWSRRKLAVIPVVNPPDLDAQVAAVPAEGNQIVLLIGAPRSGKDQTAIAAVRRARASQTPAANRPPAIRISLSDALTDEFMKKQLTEIERLESDESRLDCEGRFWIHVSNLETQLINSDLRAKVMQFLEAILVHRPGTPPRALIVTSSVDPIAHFEELFQEERGGAYKNAIPEVELSRTSLLLTRFRRCYARFQMKDANGEIVPARDRDPWSNWLRYDPREWRQTLKKEVGGYWPLTFIADELEVAWHNEKAVSAENLARAIREKADAAYGLLWSSCTRSEKLVLVQLAQEGFVNPKSREIVAQLVAKGIIIQRPSPAVFNYTFRAFLRQIEHGHIIQEWERGEGAGLWQVSGRLIASLLLASGLFFLVTQDFPVQSLLPIISGSGLFGLPLARSLMAHISAKAPGVSAG